MSQTFRNIFDKLLNKIDNVKVLSLSTSDGFNIYCETSDDFTVEADKLSAVGSSLAALSHAAAKQLVHGQFKSTFIETNKGLMYLIKTEYQGNSCILSLISGENPNLGHIRFYVNKIADGLRTITLSKDG